MKKFVISIIIVAMIIIFAGCDGNKDQTENKNVESASKSFEPIEPSQSSIENPKMEGQDKQDIDSDKNKFEPDWSDISNGELNEQSFIQKLDTDMLEEVAAELQSLVDEEIAEEKENPDIILTEGYTRVFHKEQYLRVLDMGERAEMPLYFILYKSKNDGMYEHICAEALSELTGLEFMNESGEYLDWSTGKEYLKLFNEYIGGKIRK